MTSSTRLAAALSALAAVALIAGCTSTPGSSAPTSSASPDSTASTGPSDDMEGALLDDGRMFAVVTSGSSTCIPQVESATAEGQTISVTLTDGDDAGTVCTADYAPRASVGAVPEGVDPTKEITLKVTYGDVSDTVDLDGDPAFTGVPGTSTEYTPSAGWVDDGTLVLLTWGSSSCPPAVVSLDGSGATGTVSFLTDESKVCTMDMAPRATLLAFGDDKVADDGFMLTLVGGGLDGTVAVRG
ncbi:MAG: hypothetical protein J7484_02475 [Microbacterium sp.]|nr:hypothetical protein [Microbacterium sp.]